MFFNFDYASSYNRKNPEAILRAFAQTLVREPNAQLVFKTMCAKKCAAQSARLHTAAAELGLADRLVTIDDFIPQEDLVNLTNACDVYMQRDINVYSHITRWAEPDVDAAAKALRRLPTEI